MKKTPKQKLLAVALVCALCLAGLFPTKASAATVVVTSGRGRYYHHGSYYPYHYKGGYYNYHYHGNYYLYHHRGHYYNSRVWVAPVNGHRGYYRYW
jgi:hypothetical protein